MVHYFLYPPRRPRRPTLFPYTTLFRSEHLGDLLDGLAQLERAPLVELLDRPLLVLAAQLGQRTADVPLDRGEVPVDVRSEEHTSELQSHVNLVCRLLLEKKKKIFVILE